MTEIKFEVGDYYQLNDREEKAVREVETALWGLSFREFKHVLAEVIAKLDDTGYYPHWLYEKQEQTETST